MPTKAAVLFSGGKDSTFSIFESIEKGFQVETLITMVSKNPHSYMFHRPNIHLAEKLAKSMGIPIIIQETAGEKEKELEDLRRAIMSVRKDVNSIVAGGIASKYQADRIGKICQAAGLHLIAPIWHIEPGKYWKMLLRAGFKVMIVGVSADGLGKEWLGRIIDEHAFRELKTLSKKFDFHMAFEGGEAETLVIDAPIYRKKLVVLDAKVNWDGDSGTYDIENCVLVDKKMIEEIRRSYNNKKDIIQKRLEDFREIWKKSEKTVLAELSFCLCTPQSKAVMCNRAINLLLTSNILLNGNEKEIVKKMDGVRFKEQKASRIAEAVKKFSSNGVIEIKKHINEEDILGTREWLVDNVKGIGYKEASHFLRNIGFGSDVAILDRHILRNLKTLGVIEDIPKTLTPKKYKEIEHSMKAFSASIGIGLDELDLLFWSKETGHVFK